jgi:hypothetical protein
MSNKSFEWCRVKATVIVAVFTVMVALVSVSSARAEDSRSMHIQFIQQDAMQVFDPATGKGYQIGTATGEISGTTFVEFQFTPVGSPVGEMFPITFQSKVIITDIDGDQLFFDNDGTGSFHFGNLSSDFRGSGGPMTGTYVVTGATGKHQKNHRWEVGSKYSYRAVWTKPPSPPERLGTVYAEVGYPEKDKHR